MFTNAINLNHLPIFECVYRKRSMTESAKELHMTQSGVSQHIKTLEDFLGLALFDRIQQRLLPTDAAHILYQGVTAGIMAIEDSLANLKKTDTELTGMVRIGMPIEFGNNMVLPLLGPLAKKHPKIRYKFVYDFASAMNTLLLNGELDFAFVDEFRMDKSIQVESVYDETLLLCASKNYVHDRKIENSKRFYETLTYVEYQSGEPLLRMWFEHHIKNKGIQINVHATLMDVQGIARLIQEGFGAGILPSYLVDRLEKNSLYVFNGCGKPLKNTISIAHIKDKTLSTSTKTALEHLRKYLKKS